VTISNEEFSALVKLPATQRYVYLIKRVADQESLWSLKSPDGWVLFADGNGKELVPIWSDEKFASACATGIWRNADPQPISLDAWQTRWLPGIARDGRKVVVFPTPADRGCVVECDKLAEDLTAEADKYE